MRIDMSPFDKIEQKLHCLGAKKKLIFRRALREIVYITSYIHVLVFANISAKKKQFCIYTVLVYLSLLQKNADPHRLYKRLYRTCSILIGHQFRTKSHRTLF